MSELVEALLYGRVSREEQDRDGTSLPAQLREGRAYVARRAGWVVRREFQDVESGLRDDRDHYQALLAEARRLRAEGRRVAVVVAALDRFGRRLLERVRSREELARLGVPVHSVREGGEVSDLVANILAAVAQEESRRTGERIAAAGRYIRAEGWAPGGRLPWGYVWRDGTPLERAAGAPRRVPAVDAELAPLVREVYERAAAGESMRGLLAWLRGLPVDLRRGLVLGRGGVYRMLRRRTYVGQLADGRPGRWPALVAESLWRRVQVLLDRHARMPRQASGRFLLTGLLRCPRCGRRMFGQVKHKRSGSYIGYACMGMQERVCGETASGAVLEAAVLRDVAERVGWWLGLEGPVLAAVRGSWERERRPPDEAGPAARRRALEAVGERARQRLGRAARLYADGALDRVGYELVRDGALAEIAAADSGLARLAPVREELPLPPLEVVLGRAEAWSGALVSGDVGEQREVLVGLVERVSYRRVRYGVYGLELEWTRLGDGLGAVGAGVRVG